MQGGQFDTADNLTPRTIWHHHKFYISTIVWPQNMIRNILIATIYLFDWKLSCIMSLYQIRARQGPHIKTYLISWQLFGPKISLEIHCWPITTFFKTVGENFSQCQIDLFCMMVSNFPRCQIVRGVKLSHHPMRVLPRSWCRIEAQVLKITNGNAPLIDWTKNYFICHVTHVGRLSLKKMRLKALLFNLWPFENPA